ncbi:transmembrane protein 272-like [Pyxicephalus adspersus]|uniref:transmembrane protein 272-like n=1 Tax=Pyxicephalus adspersus TaxID=30357 RepID=UPI003B5942BC
MDSPSSNLGVQIFSFIILTGLSIAEIVMGAIHKDQCPIQFYIPDFLIVTGVINLVALALLFIRSVFEILCLALERSIGLISFGWFITGSVWVFSVYNEYEGHCNKDLYLFAFGILLFHYVLIGIILLCSCFCCSPRAYFYERFE